ncbi:hypothetical protein F6X40_10060 [Paraburkholderia sp. UCT31]|uniref:hypothetical protein n=1 Tax=Paraburkholderia sp. UCT31 TaxID=2615209 RepID=UPI0016550331|nr:hypothetical protein [Paraburkholderia sp. UCT31]MBC8737151.1 hypothetical protein [Paraburkholderia sp. UCT31]
MPLTAIEERDIHVGADVRAAIDVLKSKFGAQLTHDSGHGRDDSPALKPTAPTWIYTLPRHGDAQVAVRMNKEKLSMYLRARTRQGAAFEPLLEGLATVEEHYVVGGQKPPASLLSANDAPYLQVSANTPLLRVKTSATNIESVLNIYLG